MFSLFVFKTCQCLVKKFIIRVELQRCKEKLQLKSSRFIYLRILFVYYFYFIILLYFFIVRNTNFILKNIIIIFVSEFNKDFFPNISKKMGDISKFISEVQKLCYTETFTTNLYRNKKQRQNFHYMNLTLLYCEDKLASIRDLLQLTVEIPI